MSGEVILYCDGCAKRLPPRVRFCAYCSKANIRAPYWERRRAWQGPLALAVVALGGCACAAGAVWAQAWKLGLA